MGDRRKLLTHIKNVLYLSIVLTILPMMWMEEDVEDAKDGICLTERSGHRLEA